MLLEISDLDVGYGDVQVVRGVSFAVEEGEILTVLGSNGAGKSTLLNAVAGTLAPSRGDIRYRGTSILGLPPHRIVELGVSMVPEGRHIFPSMTVLENLELGSFCRRARPRRRETLDSVFTLFPQLRERVEQMAGTLSGGEQQMLAIGRGLMAVPELLILDEPSLGLAPIVVQEIFEVIRRVNRSRVSVLLVEQNAMQSLQLAGRGCVLENGVKTIEGTGGELLNNPYVKSAYLGV